MPMKNKPSHLKALLTKNWIVWKRSWCVSLLEIIVPVLFSALLLSFRDASPPEDVALKSYYNDTNWVFTYDNTLSLPSDSGLIKNCFAAKNGGKVALAPTGDSIVNSLNTIFTNAGLTTQIFDSEAKIDEFTLANNYASEADLNLCLGVVINKNNVNNKYQYTLKFNTTTEQGDEDIPPTSQRRIKDVSRQYTDSLKEYGKKGFLLVQNLIDNLILQQETSNAAAKIQAQVTSITVEAHTKDDLAANLRGQSRIFLDIPLLLPFLRLLNGILREKENKIREGMKIMGLKNSAFYLSWLITYFIIFTIISLLVSLVLTSNLFLLSSFGLVFLWHWEFTMCLMCLAFLISVFFSKAKLGNIAGFVISLVLAFFESLTSNEGTTQGAFIGASIAPHTSLGQSLNQILSLEAAQLGLTSDTVDLDIANYKIAYHFGMMFFDIVIFLVLGSYLDQVLPSDFGIRKHPLFCLMRKKKNNSRSQVSDEKDQSREILVTDEKYQSKEILKNLENFEETDPSLKLQDEANESIIIQNLKKIYSSGKLAVDNVSFNMYKSQIFALLGHNGAGKTTTISMITGMFGSTEGFIKIFGMDNQDYLDEIRKIMGVCPQHDILFDTLTVKEHLELYAVFKGVPSSEIKKEVEKIIEDIGLSDKRDYLSKNLSGGQKRKLSIGIAFIGGSKFIVLDEPSSGMDTSARRKLWDMLKNYKNNRVVLLTTHFMDEADYLGDRIAIMGEGKLKCLGRPLFLKSKFGVGYNLTLVKKDINDPSQPIKDLVKAKVPESKLLSDVSAEVAFQLPLESTGKFQGLFDELDNNLAKLSISTYGISVTTLEEVFLNVAKITTPEKHFQQETPEDTKPHHDDLDEFDIKDQGIKSSWDLFRTHFAALVVKRVQYFKRDKRGLICEIFLPVIMIILGIVIGTAEVIIPSEPLPLYDTLYGFKFEVSHNTLLPSGSTPVDANFLNKFNTNTFTLAPKSVNDIYAFDQAVFDSQGKDIIYSTVNVFSFYMRTLNSATQNYEYTTFINTRAQEGSPFAVNKINNAILQYATGNTQKEINVIVGSFTKTKGLESYQNLFEGITFAFVFAIGMSFIPASVVTFIVKERELNAKHQQIVSGVSLWAYWLANYFVDIAKYLIPAIINSLIAMAFNAKALIEGDKLGALWLIFILYGFGVISFVYLIAFIFKDHGTAQIACFFFNFGTGFLGGVALSLLRLYEDTRDIAKILQWVLRPLPTFSMTYGFLNLANREAYALTEGLKTPLDVFDINLVFGDIVFLIGDAVVYLALVFLIEKLKNKQSLAVALSSPKEMDDDVQREEKAVENSDNSTYAIKVDKLRKVYVLGGGKRKVAVDRVSFGVKNGECFALLGVNGAGKTTTFKILSGDYLQTSGKAFITGYSIPNQLEKARKSIGYCPQFDALLDNLTAKEHLYLYAKIKGIPARLRGRLVEKQLREMNLKQYANIPAGTYSGGNKRKLSVAIAMIGNPAVVFLDEPSTGMDPEARRFMWNVISRISRERKQSSVILTTHSMEEAEALATKMGIMVNGNLKCLGTSQHIKNKFGGGYEIEVKLNHPTKAQIQQTLNSIPCTSEEPLKRARVDQILDQLSMAHLKEEINDEGTGSAIHVELKKGSTSPIVLVEWILIEMNGAKLKNFLTQNFGDIIVLEHFQSFYRFKTSKNVSIGKFFGILEANKANLDILQYSIRQSTIEQIFNAFANGKVPVKAKIQTDIEIVTE